MSSNKKRAQEAPPESVRVIALTDALAKIERSFGAGAVMRLGDGARVPVPVISTGSLGVDLATGCGGYPRGRVVEVFGPEASGKTTLALHAIASCQAAGGVAAIIDAEHALDPVYAAKLGVDLDALLVAQPDNGEQALDICEALVGCGGVDLVVVDSVAALVPRAELEGEMGDQQVGLQARLMSKATRKLTAIAGRTRTCVFFINQLRQKIGVTFGSGEVTTGGNALKYYASLRLDVRRIGAIKNGTDVVGNRTRVKIVKNKLAPPFRQVELELRYGEGLAWAPDLLDRALDLGLVTRAGAWFSRGEERLGMGREKALAWLEEHPQQSAELRAEVLAAHGVGVQAAA